MREIGCEISLWMDNEGTEGYGVDVFVVVFVNRGVELLKGAARYIAESAKRGPHTLDRIVVFQEGHEIVFIGFTGHNEFVYIEDHEPFGVGHANYRVLQHTLSADLGQSWSYTATFVIVFMVGRPNVRHISAVDHEVG